jgi:hypothetical protein
MAYVYGAVLFRAIKATLLPSKRVPLCLKLLKFFLSIIFVTFSNPIYATFFIRYLTFSFANTRITNTMRRADDQPQIELPNRDDFNIPFSGATTFDKQLLFASPDFEMITPMIISNLYQTGLNLTRSLQRKLLAPTVVGFPGLQHYRALSVIVISCFLF